MHTKVVQSIKHLNYLRTTAAETSKQAQI